MFEYFTMLKLIFNFSLLGFWFFHCHFIYHQASGMEMVFNVGEQKDLPPVPPNFPKCGNFLNPIKDILRS